METIAYPHFPWHTHHLRGLNLFPPIFSKPVVLMKVLFR
jgi:hypothetical protein